MNDQVNENQIDETDVAPVEAAPEAPKGPLIKEFTQKGESVMVAITPTDPDDDKLIEKVLEVAFGEFVTFREGAEDDKSVSGRFQVSYPRVIDGLEDNLIGLGVDPKKAMAMVVKQSGRGTLDDYMIDADFEEDFWKQKIEVEKADPNDIWKSAKFKDVLDEVASLRSEVETGLEAIQDNQEGTQDEARTTSKMVGRVYEMLGNSRPAIASWAKGAGGKGGNMPLLSKLGQGPNALTEFMRIGQLTDAEYAVLPASTVSGKSIDRHKSKSIAALVDKAGVQFGSSKGEIFVHTNKGIALPGIDGTAELLRKIALTAFEVPIDAPLGDIVDAVNEVAAEKAAAFSVDFGKHVNTYDTKAYTHALMTYGRVTVSDGGGMLFRKAVEGLHDIASITFDTEDGLKNALYGLFTGNLMLKHALKVATDHYNTLAKEKRNRDLLKNTDIKDGPITAGTAKGFAKLDALPAAAHLFKMLETHPDAPRVWEELKSLVSQNALKKTERLPDNAPAPEAD